MPQQTPLTEKDSVIYKDTFIPFSKVDHRCQGFPVQESNVLQNRGHELMDMLLRT